MTIIEAMQAAAAGAKVRRVDNKSVYVFLPAHTEYPRCRRFIGTVFTGSEWWYTASHGDYTAEWEVVPDEAAEGGEGA